VLLKLGDNISTDEIMPAGSQILPYRSNIPELSKFVFHRVDESFYQRAMDHKRGDFMLVGGNNYGQGSSREHAALAPRYLGLKIVLAKSFARIHWQNLGNFGILPLVFDEPGDYDRISQGDVLEVVDINKSLAQGNRFTVHNKTRTETYKLSHALSSRQVEMILEGGLINVVRKRQQKKS